MRLAKTPRSPLVGVGAIIARDGAVLLVRRGEEPGRGLWSLPGGKVRWGECLRHAVQRECLEETGLKVTTGDVAGVTEALYPSAGHPSFHYVLIGFFCEIVSGEPVAGSDALEVRWQPLENLHLLPLTDGLAEKLRAWITP